MMNTAILIPAYEPDVKLVNLIIELSRLFSPSIVVVDDGSSEKCRAIFNTIEKLPKCRVIHHNKNKGKGAALKTGFAAVLRDEKNFSGVITVDADGQHLPEDILKVREEFEKNSGALVLGSRDFSLENVPAKSSIFFFIFFYIFFNFNFILF